MKKPIKRHEALKPLSREHHHGLLLCWKIRQGVKLDVNMARIKSYTDWFRRHYLDPHFEAEEKYIFPVLGNDHELVKRALAEHRRLKRLFNQEADLAIAMNSIEEELDSHIRFEERVLFNEIQAVATEEQLADIEKHHNGIQFSDDDWKDHFWQN
ncbi:hemerythrin domain-containing protein [Antarcticibacterium flavum]|uniref:Hemerythrin domain-containing protein n=1 Tax=Antarcticibacterium flavum TaxID=2058175 RepID=A0A5B7X4P0_9FLAO|nr:MULTISPECIES: hemerythrin domain-containing protein [Antarcticibacterium]MCM4158278.1 cation-binding protein [Antarcticibacterium sp. W02-3]QCY70045.1 hemerythrin domain-containing protein [Antarcticibacterium flavum]